MFFSDLPLKSGCCVYSTKNICFGFDSASLPAPAAEMSEVSLL